MNTGTPVVIDHDLYTKLVAIAKWENRSIKKQLRVILEAEIGEVNITGSGQ